MKKIGKLNREIEPETISKNWASSKWEMNSKRIKKYFVPYLFVISSIMMQSCGAIALRGHYANLSHNSTYKSMDLQLTTPFDRFNIEFYLGAGQVDISKSDLDYTVKEKEDASKLSLSLGVGGTYYITKTRFQPLISLEIMDLPYGSAKDKDKKGSSDIEKAISGYYVTVTPKAGFRFYLTNNIALNGTLGYQMGTLNINDQKNKLSGFTPSVGISFILLNKL